jgi:hypothetical protein
LVLLFLFIEFVTAHAAVCLLCYLDNPTTEATPADAVYVSFGLMNVRSRLLPQYNNYVGYGLGVQAIAIPASAASSSASQGEKAQLLEVAQMTRAEYTKIKTNPVLVRAQPLSGQVVLEGAKTA